MVGALYAVPWKKVARQASEAPLHPVAHHRAADLLRNRDPKPDPAVAVAARPDQQDEAGHGGAPAAIGGQEVGSAGE